MRASNFLRLLLLSATLLSLNGCQAPQKPLRVGTNLWIGYDPIYLAVELGYITEADVQLVEFTSATESVRAYRNGLIDVAALTGDEVLRVCATQGQQEVFMVCDWSNGADVVLAQPSITTLAELKGKRVGSETTALGAYMIRRALESVQLTVADVELVNVPLSRHSLAFTSGEVDAIVTFEPHRSNLLKAGARNLFDSSDIPKEIIDVLISNPNLTPGMIQQRDTLVAAWNKGIRFITDEPKRAAQMLSRRQAITESEVDDLLSGVILVNKKTNNDLFQSGAPALTHLFEQLRQFMVQSSMLNDTPPLPLFEPASH